MLDKVGASPVIDRPADVVAVAYYLDGPRAGQSDRIKAIPRGKRELPYVDEWLTAQSTWGPVRYRRAFVTEKDDGSLFVAYSYQTKET